MNDRPADTEIFDKNGFINRMMGDQELAVEIMSEYLVDVDAQIQKLKNEASRADIIFLVRLAHTIKGASANVGAKAMQKTAFRAEQAAAKGDRTELMRLVPEVDAQLSILKSVLSNMGYLNGISK